MSKGINIDLKSLPDNLRAWAGKLSHYSIVLFCAFLVIIYGFIIFRVTSLSTASPVSQLSPSSQKTIAPHIDQKVVDQLLKLKDNSVSVKALFDEARDNPFQE